MRFNPIFLLGMLFFGFQTIVAQPVTPPIALHPADGDTVHTPNPVFSWVAVAGEKPDTRYQFLLVTVHANQSAVAAITSNPPYYEETLRAGEGMLLYPNYAPAMVPGTQYAWQVSAINEASGTDYSKGTVIPGEVKSFAVAPEKAPVRCIPELKKTADGSYTELKTGWVQATLPKDVVYSRSLFFGISWDGEEPERLTNLAKYNETTGTYDFEFNVPKRYRKGGLDTKARLVASLDNGLRLYLDFMIKP